MADCHHVTLASNGVAQVEHCTECGCVSIHLGPTTVRVDATTLDALSAVLGEASAILGAERDAVLAAFRGLA